MYQKLMHNKSLRLIGVLSVVLTAEAELLALFLSWYCFARNRKKYGYA